MEDIERYVLDDMHPSERQRFDRLMLGDKSLQEKVREARAMLGFLQQRHDQRSHVKDLLRKTEAQLPPLTPADLAADEEE